MAGLENGGKTLLTSIGEARRCGGYAVSVSSHHCCLSFLILPPTYHRSHFVINLFKNTPEL